MLNHSCVAALLAVMVVPALGAEVNLPVTKVTSFNSGVAYYEHNGQVTGDAQVLLKFKTDQINDILKSLVPLDLSGHGAANVSYASQEPLARALKSFSVDISGNPSLGALLDQVRGAEVVLSAPDQIRGKILGVEKRQQRILPTDVLVEKEYLNIASSDGIRSVPLESVSAIVLSDPKLNEELTKALALLVESRDAERKSVQVNFTGAGQRPCASATSTKPPSGRPATAWSWTRKHSPPPTPTRTLPPPASRAGLSSKTPATSTGTTST